MTRSMRTRWTEPSNGHEARNRLPQMIGAALSSAVGQVRSWVDEISTKFREGDPYAIKVTKYALDQLRFLRSLGGEPEEESQRFKRVRQSKRYPLWRLSHSHDEDVALRIICWFDNESDTVVVALFANDKAPMGDVFYDSVGSRADHVIDEWKRHNPRSKR